MWNSETLAKIRQQPVYGAYDREPGARGVCGNSARENGLTRSLFSPKVAFLPPEYS